MTVELGLVGTGIIANFHIAAVQTTPARIAVVCDVDAARGRALAAQLDARFEPDYARLLADRTIQAVLLATPNDTHFALAQAAIAAGKDVFCEKPMTTRPEESAELVRAVRGHPEIIFQVGYMKRFNPGFRLVKELLPQLGDILSAHIRVVGGSRRVRGTTWHADPLRSGGGILYHSGSHLLDVTRMLFGDPVLVDARITADPADPRRDLSTLTLLDLQAGLPVYFSTVSTYIPKVGHTQQGWEETVEVIGSQGRVLLSSPNWQGTLPCIVTVQLEEEQQTRIIYPPEDSQWALEFQAFVASLESRQQLHPDVVDGYKVDEILAAICASAADRRPTPVRWRI
jgi:myo-inositol 2-dehydrogenase/D-chiro-inositol 1-dehydrogenase